MYLLLFYYQFCHFWRFSPSFLVFVTFGLSFALKEFPLILLAGLIQWSQTPLVFVLSGTLFTSPILNDSLAGKYSWLQIFPILHFGYISCHSFLACQVSVEKSTSGLMDFALETKDFFCLAAFKIFYHYILPI